MAEAGGRRKRFTIGAASLVLAWGLFMGLPPWPLAYIATGALALSYVLRDVAMAVHFDRVLPPPRDGDPRPGTGARRVAWVRLLASAGLGTGAAFVHPLAGLIVPLYMLSCALLGDYFPSLHGGSSYPRRIYHAVVRGFVGSGGATDTALEVRPYAIGCALAAAAGVIVGPPIVEPSVRAQVAEVGITWLTGDIKKAFSNGPASPGASRTTVHAPATPTTTSAPPPPQDGESTGAGDSSLTAECGTDRLDLPGVPGQLVTKLQDEWRYLGGESLGCPTTVAVLTDGGVVLDFADGNYGPAALVASPERPTAAAVRSIGGRYELLSQDVSSGALTDVLPEVSAKYADYQLFESTTSCSLSVLTYGRGADLLDAPTTAAALTLTASIGGTIEGVSTAGSDGDEVTDMTIDLSGAPVPVVLHETGTGVDVESGPNGYVGDSFPDEVHCPTTAAAMVMSRS